MLLCIWLCGLPFPLLKLKSCPDLAEIFDPERASMGAAVFIAGDESFERHKCLLTVYASVFSSGAESVCVYVCSGGGGGDLLSKITRWIRLNPSGYQFQEATDRYTSYLIHTYPALAIAGLRMGWWERGGTRSHIHEHYYYLKCLLSFYNIILWPNHSGCTNLWYWNKQMLKTDKVESPVLCWPLVQFAMFLITLHTL